MYRLCLLVLPQCKATGTARTIVWLYKSQGQRLIPRPVWLEETLKIITIMLLKET